MSEKLQFTSDYMEGAHPAVLEALIRTNMESTPGYGDDLYCKQAEEKILKACGIEDGEVHFLVGGTQTNSIVIQTMLKPWQGVIAAESGHIAVHEAGAIEHGGHKVMTVKGVNGKLSASQVKDVLETYYRDDNHTHMVEPGMVYISQPTEYGTLYSLKEMEELSAVCREYNIPLFADGARLAYALACETNDVTLKDLGRLCDVFYIGGTKCGLLFGEAVVLTKKDLIPHFFTMIKQNGALLAKGRILGVQFDALFTDDLYEKVGEPAMKAAVRIKKALKDKGYAMPIDPETNQVCFVIENSKLPALAEKVAYGFMEKYDEDSSLIRFATAWSTSEEKADALIRVIEEIL